MKRLIFCLIVVAAMTMLLLPTGKAYSWCVKWDDFSNNLDLDKWTVQYEGTGCFDNVVVEQGMLKITANDAPNCQGTRVFVIPKTPREPWFIRAQVKVTESAGCLRARLEADPVIMRDWEYNGFHQLSLVGDFYDHPAQCSTNPPVFARFLAYTENSTYYRVFDDFPRSWNLAPGDPPILDRTHTLSLSIVGNTIISKVKEVGTTAYTVPGGIGRGNVLGLSVFHTFDDSTGTVFYDNVYVCY